MSEFNFVVSSSEDYNIQLISFSNVVKRTSLNKSFKYLGLRFWEMLYYSCP